MIPNSTKIQSLNHSLLASRVPVSVLGLLFFLVLLLVLPASRAGALPNYVKKDTLVPSNYETMSEMHLGESVAVSGDTVVAGAPNENSATGAVYVYVRPTNDWTNSATKVETAKIVPTALAAGDNFGVSVAISGDTIVVGASGDDGDLGAAYVFVKPAGGWANPTVDYTARLTVTSREEDDIFGESVAISGNTIAVGAPATNNGSKLGAAHVFTRPLLTGWVSTTATAKLTDASGAVDDDFGGAVATHGGTVVVGAKLADVGEDAAEQVDQGLAFVFVKPAGVWVDDPTPDVQLKASGGDAGDWFGGSVAIREDGKAVVVGAESAAPPVIVPPESAKGVTEDVTKGAAYVFMRPGALWTADPVEDAILSTAAGSDSDKFGHSVSISGDTIVVGAYLYAVDDADDEQQGAAFVYVQPNAGPQDPAALYDPWVTTDAPDATLSAGADGVALDLFGESVATSGGIVVAGVPNDTTEAAGVLSTSVVDPTPTEQGSAYVYVNGYCSADADGKWHVDATWAGGGIPPTSADVCISTGHVIEMDAVPAADRISDDPPIPVVRRLLVNAGAQLKLLTFDIQVNQEVINNGTLQQVKTQGFIGDAEFLQIEQGGGGGTRYRGANVYSDSDLGAITVELRETIDWFSPTAIFNYCTTSGTASPPYAQRCYSISPTSTALSSITLWGLADELNGIPVIDLAVYHSGGGGFTLLTPVTNSAPDAGSFIDYEYAKGDTSDFSEFILGDKTTGPTAVTMIAIGGGEAAAVPVVLLASMALLAMASLGLLVHLRRKRA